MKSDPEVEAGAGFTKRTCEASSFAEWQGRVSERGAGVTGIPRQGGDRFEER